MELLPEQTNTQALSAKLPTLDEVQGHFQRWRSTRDCRGQIPPALWDQVFLLVDHYRETDICSKLGITKSRLKEALLKKSSQGIPSSSMDFIPLTLSHPPSHHEPKTKDLISAEILHTNGATLRMTSLNEQQFSNLLHVFMKGY